MTFALSTMKAFAQLLGSAATTPGELTVGRSAHPLTARRTPRHGGRSTAGWHRMNAGISRLQDPHNA